MSDKKQDLPGVNARPAFVSFEEYALTKGASIAQMPHATFIRATANMSGAALRRAQAQHARNLADWQTKRDAARREFEALTGNEEIAILSRKERLIRRARGDPNRPSVQAARRLLEKQGLLWD